MTQHLLSLAELCLLFLLPGSMLIIVIRNRRLNLAELLLYGFAFSVALVVFVSALLLWGGHFSMPLLHTLMISMALILAIIAVMQKRDEPDFLQHLASRDSLRNSLAPIVVVAVVVLLGMLTPHWNFLLGSNMDAGNYEVYSNHFLRTGSLFLESEALSMEGAHPSWFESGNSWNVIPGTLKAKPSFFPAFPILLAVAKGVLETPLASTFVPLALAAASAGLLTRASSYAMGNIWLASLFVVSTALTPIFFFYSKQIMSEAIALLGASLLVDVLVRHRTWISNIPALASTAIGAGMFLSLTAKLDAFVLLALLPIGLTLIMLDRSHRGLAELDRLKTVLGPSIGVISAVALVALLADPGYASKLVPGRAIEYISPSQAILGYGLLFAGSVWCITLLLNWHSRASDETLQSRRNGPGLFGLFRLWWLAAAWLMFVVWNLLFRPRVPFDVDHNPHNLLRLFDVVDPMLMTLFLTASIVVLAVRGFDRPVMIMLLVGLTILIVSSRHSRTELWWMRRYLYVLVPAITVGIAGGVRRLLDSITGSLLTRAATLTLIATTALGLIAIRTADMRPLFQLNYNLTTPQELEDLSAILRAGDVVVIPEGNSSIRALVNSKRSLDGQIMLGAIERNNIPEALQIAERLGSRVVLATEKPNGLLARLDNRGVQSIGSGTVTQPGVHYLAHVRNNPDRATTVPYEIFALTS